MLLLALLTMLGCSANPSSKAAKSCDAGLAKAYKELEFAEAKGFAGTWQYTKAASLLSAAKIQYEFGKYPNCIDKVKRARVFIKQSQGK